MANYEPLPNGNKYDEEDTIEDTHFSEDDSEEAGLMAKSKQQYAELEIDDSSAFEESPLHHNQAESFDESPSRLPTDGGSIFESFVNMANSIVGAGIIGLPFAFKEAVSNPPSRDICWSYTAEPSHWSAVEMLFLIFNPVCCCTGIVDGPRVVNRINHCSG
jgi:hypothetical protein